MSDYPSVKQAIRQRFRDEITLGGDGGAPVPTRFPNDPTDPANPTAEFEVPATGVWCDLNIRTGTNQQTSFGGATNHFRRTGALLVACYGPLNEGEGALEALIARIETAFRDAPKSFISYRAPVPDYCAASGKWWKINVTCEWHANERH